MGRTRRESADTKENNRRATTNHYAVMGLHDFARGSEAKRAYHRLALEWHPDRQVHAPEHRQKEAEDMFKRINEAYAILSDSVRRKEFDLILRNELLGMAGGDAENKTGAKDATKNASHTHDPNGSSSKGGETRLILCPECGVGAEAKAGKKGGPSLQCQGCSAFFHEVYCAGCKDWGATNGRRGESTMRCGCGNVFCQSRCPSCWRWNTFNGEAQGGRTRSCGFCGCKFHEAFCPGCSSWGVWEGKKGCRSLSCDCGGLFYEISCQSCGMWGSVKGRHADDTNSLRCGTCGSESHEAFCPTCRQWDSYPGSRGESTLACKSPRCCGRQGRTATKFFQVYCETCVCWRSVLGEKDAVGRASIRCEGCKTNLRGTTCPACGNWDQLLGRSHQHQAFRRKTRLHEKQPQPGTADSAYAGEKEGGTLLVARPRPMCTSCGHQPPESPGDDEALEEAFPGSNVSLTGVVHGDADATASAGPTAAPVGAATTFLAEAGVKGGGERVRDARQVEETKMPPSLEVGDGPVPRDSTPSVALRSQKNSPGPATENTETIRAEQGQALPPKAVKSAPVHGMDTNPRPGSDEVSSFHKEKVGEDSPSGEPLASNGKAAEDSDRQRRRQARKGISSSASSTATSDDDAEAEANGEQPGFQSSSLWGVPPSVPADGDGSLPVAPVPSEGTTVPRAAKPPPRSTLRRRRGRRPFVPRHPSVSASPVEGAEAELASVKARTTSETQRAKEEGAEGGEDGEATAAVLLTPSLASLARPERTDNDRPASRNRGAGRRRRPKRLGSRSSSSSPSPRPLSSKPASTTPPTGSLLSKNRVSVGDDHPLAPALKIANGDDGDAAAGRVTFAAVPRESSPPPPPGMRISGKEGEGEAGGPGHRSGAKEMVHLAFCSRCQEYQSWRAPLTRTSGRRLWKETASSGGGSGSPRARRNCTECGDLYSNVSYYPAR